MTLTPDDIPLTLANHAHHLGSLAELCAGLAEFHGDDPTVRTCYRQARYLTHEARRLLRSAQEEVEMALARARAFQEGDTAVMNREAQK